MVPAANHAPTVNVGPDRETDEPNEPFFIEPTVGDVDNDWLTFQWTDEAGNSFGTTPRLCLRGLDLGEKTYTLTVTDGRGGMATDSVRLRVFIRNPTPIVIINAPVAFERVQAGQPYVIRCARSTTMRS